MKYPTLEKFMKDYKKRMSGELVVDFFADYFKNIYPTKFCDSFYCNDKFDQNDGLFVKLVLHGEYFAETVNAYPFDIKSSITDSQSLVVAWRKHMMLIFPNYKQAYREYYLKKQEEKIEQDLLEF